MTLFLFSVAFALSVSFICSILEATLLSFTSSQVAALSTKRPGLGAIWAGFKTNIEKPIAVILITNTTAHTVGATIAGAQFESLYGSKGLFAFSIVFTYAMLQFTEILPKSLGVRFNGLLAPMIALPLHFLSRVLAPVLWFIHLVNRPFMRAGGQQVNTLEEIAALAASARLSRLIDPQQARMIQAASELEDISVRQVMTPRTYVKYLHADMEVHEILDILKKSPFTRLPLCEPDLDHVIGMVHVKDIIRTLDLMPGRFHLERLETARADEEQIKALPGTALHVFGAGSIDLMQVKRDVIFLPEQISLLDALRRFQDALLHLGIVVNEHGGTLGIVTLEDVIEEMVGEIRDEFDLFTPEMIHKEDQSFRVNGQFPLHELGYHVPYLGIDHTQEDADTVGGFITHLLARMPEIGDTADMGLYRWTVTAADARRVREVLISPIEEQSNLNMQDEPQSD